MPVAQAPKAVSLTQVATVARKVISVGAIVLVVMIVGRIFLESLVGYWKATHPEPPPPPSVGFGILPSLVFPENKGNPTSYTLSTTQEKLRAPSDRAPVFFMPAARPSLLAFNRAKKQAQDLGFLLEPEKVNEEVYRWGRSQPLTQILDYNIVNGTFRLKLDWQSDPNFLQNKQLLNEEQSISYVRAMLQSSRLSERDIATGSAKVAYLKATINGYEPTVSFSESDFLQVDIFRTDIGSRYPVVSDEPSHGVVRAILTGNPDKNLKLSELEYNYLKIDYEKFETYPIITPSEAFELLQKGRGYTAVMPSTQSDIIIRNIKLGYFDGIKQQLYLQPIYILEGDGGYVGYVSAIQASYMQSSGSSN